MNIPERRLPGVLMITGAYYPELSGGGLQCKAIVDALRSEARFVVLTTCTDPALPPADEVDGTPVRRVHVDVSSPMSFRSSLRRYRIMSVSERCVLKTGCVRNAEVRASAAG